MTGPHAGRLCLIGDDSRTVGRIARRIVGDAGMRAIEARDGVEALSLCRKDRPDYVLLDWNMPNMNGLDCLKAIRSEFGESSPAVILCTTKNDPTHIAASMQAGAEELVMKSFYAAILPGKLDLKTSQLEPRS